MLIIRENIFNFLKHFQYLFLIFSLSCKDKIENGISSECINPVGIHSYKNVLLSNSFYLKLDGDYTKLKNEVIWEIKNIENETIENFKKPPNTEFQYNFKNDGKYLVIAKMKNICGEELEFSENIIIDRFPISEKKIEVANQTVSSGLRNIAITNEGYLITGNFSGKIEIWDTKNSKLINSFNTLNYEIDHLKLFDDNETIVISSYAGIRFYNWKSGNLLKTVNRNYSSNYLSATNDKKLIAYGDQNNISFLNLENNKTVTFEENIKSDKFYVNFSKSQSKFGFGGEYYDDGKRYLNIIDIVSLKSIFKQNINALDFVFDIDENFIWVLTNGTIEKWDIISKKILKSISPYHLFTDYKQSYHISLSKDGRYIYVGNYKFETNNLEGTRINDLQYTIIEGQSLSPNNLYYGLFSQYGNTLIYDLGDNTRINILDKNKHEYKILKAFQTDDFKKIYTLDAFSLKIWNIENGILEKNVNINSIQNDISDFKITFDGFWILRGYYKSLEKIDFGNNIVINQSGINNDYINVIAISKNKELIAIINNNSVELRSSKDGKFIKSIYQNNNNSPSFFQFTADTKYFIQTMNKNSTIQFSVYDLEKNIQELLPTDLALEFAKYCIANDRPLIGIQTDNKFTEYDFFNKKKTKSFKINALNREIKTVKYSSENKNIGMAFKNILEVYSRNSGKLIYTFKYDNPIVDLFFNKSGTKIYVVTEKEFHVEYIQIEL